MEQDTTANSPLDNSARPVSESARDEASSRVRLSDRRSAIAAAVAALKGLGEALWEAGDAGLAQLLGELDELVSLGQAGQFVVAAEAADRGATSSTLAGGSRSARSVSEWLLAHAPSMHHGGSRRMADLISDTAGDDAASLRSAITSGEVPMATAARVTKEMARLSHRLQPQAVSTVWQAYTDLARAQPRLVGSLRPAMLARYGAVDEFQKDQDFAHRFVSLSSGLRDGALWVYHLHLDAEGRSVLESAIGPLSAPKAGADRQVDLRSADLRSADQRRGHALVEVCRRATAAATDIPATPKSQLVVTCNFEDLKARVGAGTTTGGLEAGTLIAPETVRKLACDAQIIPAILGTEGEALEWGRAKRLFTPTQIKALWERDGGCTFPGCSTPPGWCDAHHLRHWVDFGETNLTNAALLCGFHHTSVHQRRLAGRLVRGGPEDDQDATDDPDVTGLSPARVAWDLTRGSYDHQLAGINLPDARAG